MSGAGALVTPLLGLEHYQGVVLVGIIVVTIVVTAGMVSTTYVQFIKGSMLVVFCAILTVMILNRGLTTHPEYVKETYRDYRRDVPLAELSADSRPKARCGRRRLEGASPTSGLKMKRPQCLEIWREDAKNPELLSETQSERKRRRAYSQTVRA